MDYIWNIHINGSPLSLYLLLYYFIYREGCTYTPDFLNRLKEACPDARVTTEIGEGGKIIETNFCSITTFLFYICVYNPAKCKRMLHFRMLGIFH